jgi:hypothetical protein
MVGPKIPPPWLKKDILSHACTGLTRAHQIFKQHKKNSHNHGWFVSISRWLSCSRRHQTLHHIYLELSICYRTIPRYTAIFLPIFDWKRPHTTTSGHDSPHPQPTKICSRFVYILLLFIKDVLVRCLLNPPLHSSCRIHIICCSDIT